MDGHRIPTRPYLRRGSPLSVFNPSQGFTADAPMIQRIDVGDSSDDDIPQPMKFSALTKALLESEASPPKQGHYHELDTKRNVSSQYAHISHADKSGIDTPSRAPILKIVRKASPTSFENGSSKSRATSPRIVTIDSSRRTVSVSDRYTGRSREGTPAHEFITPAPAPRAARLARTRADSNPSPAMDHDASIARPGSHGTRNLSATIDNVNDAATSHMHDTGFTHVPSTLARSRNTSAEAAGPPGSTRVKRVPIGTGTFLRGAPVRRGFRRRESDENVSPIDEQHTSAEQPTADEHANLNAHDSVVSKDPGMLDTSAAEAHHVSKHDFAQSRLHADHEGAFLQRESSLHDRVEASSQQIDRGPSIAQPLKHRTAEPLQIRDRSNSVLSHDSIENAQKRPSQDHGARQKLDMPLQQRPNSIGRPQQRPPSRIHTDATDDQENMPPPTFKRNKDQDFKYLRKVEKVSLHNIEKARHVADTPVPVSVHESPRRALAAMSANTPVRPAPPPPPKMSVLDAATKTAGASTTKSKKKRQHILCNGKLFTQMNKIGRGGSSDVYCVMAENYKLFALKKVKLEDCDETAMRGFKGEIDLLKKLENVDRVVRLFDWELDNDKQQLLVLMEKGDNDLARILTTALNGTDPRFDPVLTRFYWKEMVECVAAVHEHDIVHSDLKPANFLSVQGKLKLIDFGIANAIDIDNTVNVHRESHIGTPNYMSPESIVDTNAPMPGSKNSGSGSRMMKLGKPSDVWSLGCILYQMVYGRPPFAHIPNQIHRIMAITNPNVVIEYPALGVGDVAVPETVKNTMRRCLQRDASTRPTAQQLLASRDAWLYPESNGVVAMSEELLGQIIEKVVERCRKGIPEKEEVRQYPASFMAKIREIVERDGVREEVVRA